MTLKQKLLLPGFFLLLAAFIAATGQSASPVRDKVLEDVQVIKNNGNLIIEVHFSFPLRYMSHFPQDSGDELRIQLKAVRVPASDADALFKREGVVPRYADTVAVDQVIYEGDIEGGPYLTVQFTREASYQVVPGSDFRSINIVVESFK
jgi:hypothetical protein